MPFFLTFSLGRVRFGGVVLATLLSIAGSSNTAFAQATAAAFYRPEVASKYPPGYVSPCPDCDVFTRLLNKEGWDALNAFDAAHPDLRPWFEAKSEADAANKAFVQAKADAEASAKEAKKDKKDPNKQQKAKADEDAKTEKGKAKDAKDTKLKKAKDKLDQDHKGGKDGGTSDALINKLNEILGTIDYYAAQITDCEAKAKKDGKCDPPKPTIAIKLPPCFDDEVDREYAIKDLQEMMGTKPFTDPPKERQRLANNKYIEEKIEEAKKLPICEYGHRPRRPGETFVVAYTVSLATDGVAWCTYSDRRRTYVVVTPTDDSGVPVDFAPPGRPVDAPRLTDRTPTAPQAPPTVAERPPSTPATRPPPTDRAPPTAAAPPVTSDTPTTTTDTPPTPVTPPTTDTPPQIPDTVFVKASETVLAGGQTGSELQNQTVKLVFAKPDLPGTGASKTAQDTGFDRDPAQCTTGAGGECKIQVHPDDRPLYGLASSGAKPGHYRLDLNLLKHSGAVAETTGNTGKPDLKDATPAGGNITDTEFKIGNRKFTRLGIDQPHGRGDDLAAFSRALGTKAEIDYCRTKKPGPPLGLEPAWLGAPNHELPDVALKLGGPKGRAAR